MGIGVRYRDRSYSSCTMGGCYSQTVPSDVGRFAVMSWELCSWELA